MRLHTFILVLLMLFVGAPIMFAQSKFGRATDEELEMTTYAEDSTASAVILHKDGKLRFIVDDLVGFQFEYTEEVKIKILKTDGLEYANREISYYEANRNTKEVIRSLSGSTYNLENGKVVRTKLSKEHIFDEDSGTNWKVRKFTLPAAKVGSVIEYKYTLTSNLLYELRDFYFQSSIPTEYVSFEALIPEYFIYNLNTQGYIPFTQSERKPENLTFSFRYKDDNGRVQTGNHRCDALLHIFKTEKVPSAKYEKNLWTINDYISKVAFELKATHMPNSFYKPYSSTWEHIDDELLKGNSLGGSLKKANWFKDDVALGEQTIENASAIAQMLADKVKWNEKNTINVSNLREALNKGIGNSAELNFLLINALEAGGFDAFPVILSTRSKGRIPITYPSVTAFNYVITGIRLDDKLYFMDAASKYGSWNILPEKCMVSQARILSETHKDWIDLQAISLSTVYKQATVNFVDNDILVKVNETRSVNDGLNAKTSYNSFDSEDKFIEHLENHNNCEIEDFTMQGLDNNSQPFVMSFVEKREREGNGDEEFFYYKPPFSKVYNENPFKAETRVFPVNFDYMRNYTQSVDIHIPEGYEVAELPQNERIVMNDNQLSFVYMVQQQGDVIKLSQRYQVRNLLFLPTDYESIRDFFARMLLKGDEQIIFKKADANAKTVEKDEKIEL